MFTYVDAIIIVLVAITVIIGIWRGFIRSLTKLCGFAVKVALSFLLCKPLAKLVSKITKLDENLLTKYTNWASGLNPDFNTNLKTIEPEQLNDFIANTLENGGVPKIFKGLLQNLLNITPETIADAETITLAELVGKALSNFLIVAGCFVAIFILLFIIIFILNRIEKHILKNTRVLSKISRGFGGIVGAFNGFSIIFTIFMITSLFRNASFFQGINNTINSSFLGGPLSRLVYKIMDNGLDFSQVLAEWVSKK